MTIRNWRTTTTLLKMLDELNSAAFKGLIKAAAAYYVDKASKPKLPVATKGKK